MLCVLHRQDSAGGWLLCREARLVASRGTVVGGGGSLGTGGWDTAHMTPSSQAVETLGPLSTHPITLSTYL